MVAEKMMFNVSMTVSLASAKKPKLNGNTFEAVMISIAERVKPWPYVNDGIRGMTGFKCGDEEYKSFEKVAINTGVRNARSKSMRYTKDKNANSFHKFEYSQYTRTRSVKEWLAG